MVYRGLLVNVRGMYGIRIQPGESWSEKYPDMLLRADGTYRKPMVWQNLKTGIKRHANNYFIEVPCSICGKDYLRDRSNFEKNDGSLAICSMKCKKKAMTKPDGVKKLKPREHGAGAHVMVKSSKHPNAGNDGYVPEHRLVVEKSLGRYLKRSEHVHHINLNKADNRLENLVICKSNKEHFSAHGSLNTCVEELINKGVLAFDRGQLRYYVK